VKKKLKGRMKLENMVISIEAMFTDPVKLVVRLVRQVHLVTVQRGRTSRNDLMKP